jgi:hypothetical protein
VAPKTTVVTLDLSHTVLATKSVLELLGYGSPSRGVPAPGEKGTGLGIQDTADGLLSARYALPLTSLID